MTEVVDKAPRRITGWTVFYGMIAFFGVIIAVNLTFVYFALDSWPGLTTQHAYEEGIAYNKTLEQAAAQNEMGWTSRVGLGAPMPKGGRVLGVIMQGPDGPLTGLDIHAKLSRPVGEGLIVETGLNEEQAGRYGGLVKLPALGRWEVEITAKDGAGRTYRMIHEIQAGN
jgi:nitrogen fixation protein FixH